MNLTKTNKTNKIKLIARVMVLILLFTSVFNLSGCYFGPTLDYNWGVNTHNEFLEEIERFNSLNDGTVNTFISFDLEDYEDVSYTYYSLSTKANASLVNKKGLCDEVGVLGVRIWIALKSDIENNEHSDHAYRVTFDYGGYHNFSQDDIIEIRYNRNPNCEGIWEDAWYQDSIIYHNFYYYNMFVNNIQIACIHISSIEEASEEKLDDIIQMLYDSLVIINTEE